MIQIIKKLRVLLDKKQKRTMVGLIILMVISAFLQTAGVGMLVEVMQSSLIPKRYNTAGWRKPAMRSWVWRAIVRSPLLSWCC